MPMIWRRCASRSASRCRLLSTSLVSWTQRGVRRSVLENRNWSQQSARLSCDLRRLVVALELAHVVLDLGQQLAALVAALRLRHQPLLELQADVAGTALARSPAVPGWPGTWPGGGWPGGSWPGGIWPSRRPVERLARRSAAARAATRATSPSLAPAASATDRPSASRRRTAPAMQAQAVRIAVSTCLAHWKIPKFPEARLRRRFSQNFPAARLWDCCPRGSMQRNCGARLSTALTP